MAPKKEAESEGTSIANPRLVASLRLVIALNLAYLGIERLGAPAIVAAGAVTAPWPSIWPDLIVGAGIALLNADAAREIFGAAREEHWGARGR